MHKAFENCTPQVLRSPIGSFCAYWNDQGLKAFLFGIPSKLPKQTESRWGDVPCQFTDLLESRLEAYFETGCFDWDLKLIDWTGVSDFTRRTLIACHAIPPATTLTYGQLAARCGSPLAARAVGRAMATNRWPLLIPCHRVVGSSGKLTGYSGTGGVSTKRKLLDLERRQLQLLAT